MSLVVASAAVVAVAAVVTAVVAAAAACLGLFLDAGFVEFAVSAVFVFANSENFYFGFVVAVATAAESLPKCLGIRLLKKQH